jgi:putative ABC transport system permease protein
MDVAEQFESLNAGAIDISYDWEGEEQQSGGGFSLGSFFSGIFGGKGGGDAQQMGNMADAAGTLPSGGAGGMADAAGGLAGGGMADGGGGFAGGAADGAGGFAGGGMTDGAGASGDMAGGFPGGGMADAAGDSAGSDMADGGFGRNSDAAGMDGTTDMRGQKGEPDGNSDAGMTDGANDGNAAPGENVMQDETADGADTVSGENAESEDAAAENSEEAETEENLVADRINQENVILTADDVEDIVTFVPGITGATISYSTRASVEGGNLTSAQTYTVAGVKENYASLSNLTLAAGSFLDENDDTEKARVCVLGQSAAKELFGSADDAEGSTIYIDDRSYTVAGVLATTGTVSGGISPDEAIFVPYETGIKYVTGESISPTITVIADDVNNLDSVIADLTTVLAENYSNTEFTFSDAGSKMEAAESSNRILTMLLTAMAGIVFLVGGIGIMNVLFVSVKERTNEIGILKSLGASRSTILMEFLIEAAAISLIGGVLGVAVSFAVTPIVELYSIRVETNLAACLAALGFAVLTGTVFGFYPAWKASRLVPVEALNAE